MKTLYLCIFLLLSSLAQAQLSDTTKVVTPALVEEHSVRKATLLSTFVPGAGQIYNKKYWKAPIVYAGLGTAIYFIDDNTKNYRKWRDNLIAEEDGDPNTVNTTGLSSSVLRENMDLRRRWLDLSYIALAGVYVLNIIDAHVDAHLFHFDVSEDLTLIIHPSVIPSYSVNAGIGLTMNF
ncbi:MAG: DUF5683 domain-containing protein [Flavobacteriales bacterium]|nr:DUF5683 domain-containing protein [Flavobacteriales bacterium]